MTPQEAARLLVDYIHENSSHEADTFNVYDTDIGAGSGVSSCFDPVWLAGVAKYANAELLHLGEPYTVDTPRTVDGWQVRFTGQERNHAEEMR